MESTQHPVITTDRLILRPYEMCDLVAVHAYAAIPKVSHYMDWGPNTEGQSRDFVVKEEA